MGHALPAAAVVPIYAISYVTSKCDILEALTRLTYSIFTACGLESIKQKLIAALAS